MVTMAEAFPTVPFPTMAITIILLLLRTAMDRRHRLIMEQDTTITITTAVTMACTLLPHTILTTIPMNA